MTQLLLYLTLGAIALIVGALVAYLLGIIAALWKTRRDLAALVAGLATVRDHTQPLSGQVEQMNQGLALLLTDLLAVNGSLAAIVRLAAQAKRGK